MSGYVCSWCGATKALATGMCYMCFKFPRLETPDEPSLVQWVSCPACDGAAMRDPRQEFTVYCQEDDCRFIGIGSRNTLIPESEPVMLELQRFARKPFYVEAVQVTAENMEAVAVWCNGKVQTLSDAVAEKNRTARYIKVNVPRAATDRQTQAFVGDWVLKAGSGFKCYNPKAFAKSFDVAESHGPVATHGWTEDPGPTKPTQAVLAAQREAAAQVAPVPVVPELMTNPIEMSPAQYASRFKPRPEAGVTVLSVDVVPEA